MLSAYPSQDACRPIPLRHFHKRRLQTAPAAECFAGDFTRRNALGLHRGRRTSDTLAGAVAPKSSKATELCQDGKNE